MKVVLYIVHRIIFIIFCHLLHKHDTNAIYTHNIEKQINVKYGYTSIPGNRGVNGGIAFSELEPLTRNPFPQRTASICCTTLVNELPAPTLAHQRICHTFFLEEDGVRMIVWLWNDMNLKSHCFQSHRIRT